MPSLPRGRPGDREIARDRSFLDRAPWPPKPSHARHGWPFVVIWGAIAALMYRALRRLRLDAQRPADGRLRHCNPASEAPRYPVRPAARGPRCAGAHPATGLGDRIRIEAGNFFESVPAGAYAYILSHIIHDWNRQQCLAIPAHCRRAMNSGGRPLLAEMVLPEGDAPHPGKLLDMVMLTVTGGEERTASQYSALGQEAGFRMRRIVPTASLVSIVEAVPTGIDLTCRNGRPSGTSHLLAAE